MKLVIVTIHNFRSIIDETFSLQEYSLIVGANNSGKSNTIDAIRLFFGDKGIRYSQEEDYPKNTTESDKDSWIEVTYNLLDDEFSKLPPQYQTSNNTVKLRKFFHVSNPKESTHKANKIYAYEKTGILSEKEFFGFAQKGKIGKVIYIPAISKLSDNLKLTGPSPFRDLMNEVMKPIIQASQSYQGFKDGYTTFVEALRNEESENGHSLNKFESDVNDNLTSWGVNFSLDIAPPTEDEIIKQAVTYRTVDKLIESEVDIEKHGSGFQRQLIYVLIKLASEYANAQKKQTETTIYKPELTLILFEEPEAFLHPTQQLLLADSLKDISDNNNGHLQVLITTHSPHFVSHNIDNLPSIIHLCRTCESTKIGQITQQLLHDLILDNQKIHEIVKGTKFAVDTEGSQDEMESIKYSMWLDPDRCGMYFANHVILVEGKSEYALLNYFLKERLINDRNRDFFIVDCVGKFNIHRYMNLLGKLYITHSVILDADNQKSIHPQLFSLICESINPFTKKVLSFETDIETFFGITKSKQTSRKPQHLLYQLAIEKKGNPESISTFCSSIESFLLEETERLMTLP